MFHDLFRVFSFSSLPALASQEHTLVVTTSVFHGVPFGLVPARLFRHCMRLVIAWLFRFCKRPNGMEVRISLLSLWLLVAEKEGFTVASDWKKRSMSTQLKQPKPFFRRG